MAASKLILPLVLQGRFDEAATQAAVMWETWQRAGRPPGWLGPAVYGMVLAHGVRGDDGGRHEWLARLGDLAGTGIDYVAGTNLAAAAAFTEARICLHEGHIDAAMAAVAGLPRGGELVRRAALALAPPLCLGDGGRSSRRRGPARRRQLAAAAAPACEETYWAAACLARAACRTAIAPR